MRFAFTRTAAAAGPLRGARARAGRGATVGSGSRGAVPAARPAETPPAAAPPCARLPRSVRR